MSFVTATVIGMCYIFINTCICLARCNNNNNNKMDFTTLGFWVKQVVFATLFSQSGKLLKALPAEFSAAVMRLMHQFGCWCQCFGSFPLRHCSLDFATLMALLVFWCRWHLLSSLVVCAFVCVLCLVCFWVFFPFPLVDTGPVTLLDQAVRRSRLAIFHQKAGSA